MKKVFVITAAVLLCMAVSARADFIENFDSYANGSGLHGQGGWAGWDNSAAANATVVNTVASSVPHSVAIVGNADMVHTFSGYTSGAWTLTSDLYVPSKSTSGDSYWIWLNQYTVGGPYNWSLQTQINLTTGQVVAQPGTTGGGTLSSTAILYGQWVQLKAVVDLDNNSYDCWYGANQIVDNGVWYGAAANIAAIDLFSNGSATPVYFDNVAITPEPVSMALLGLGGVGVLIRRRRR